MLCHMGIAFGPVISPTILSRARALLGHKTPLKFFELKVVLPKYTYTYCVVRRTAMIGIILEGF